MESHRIFDNPRLIDDFWGVGLWWNYNEFTFIVNGSICAVILYRWGKVKKKDIFRLVVLREGLGIKSIGRYLMAKRMLKYYRHFFVFAEAVFGMLIEVFCLLFLFLRSGELPSFRFSECFVLSTLCSYVFSFFCDIFVMMRWQMSFFIFGG